MVSISNTIQNWYKKNKRDLPWRHTSDPYRIWLSEVIMQQTQVVQGTSYYLKFIKAYPNVKSLAESSQEHVLKNWQGLGYYSRARNLHFAAKQITSDNDGVFPSTYSEIIKLKGVGEYTAAAIASFAYSEPYAVVDGNVFRVLSRLFAINTPINSTSGKKEFFKLAQSLLDRKNPGEHNQAMMELGALVCRPKNPDCNNCPVQFHCEAFEKKSVTDFPVKNKILKVKKRYLNYVLISNGEEILVNKRTGSGIWQGLYDFPVVESNKPIFEIAEVDGIGVKGARFDLELKHILTHQHLYAKFWILEQEQMTEFVDYDIISINNLEDLPLPQLIVRYIGESDFFKR
ncbi:MAG: A/G-specific adenine glycosylase [Crocinitomicaceae bacterium]